MRSEFYSLFATRYSLSSELLEEPRHLPAYPARHHAEIVGDRLDGLGVAAGIGGGLAHAPHFRDGLNGAFRRDVRAARDLAGGGALLGDGRRDGGGDVAHFAD